MKGAAVRRFVIRDNAVVHIKNIIVFDCAAVPGRGIACENTAVSGHFAVAKNSTAVLCGIRSKGTSPDFKRTVVFNSTAVTRCPAAVNTSGNTCAIAYCKRCAGGNVEYITVCRCLFKGTIQTMTVKVNVCRVSVFYLNSVLQIDMLRQFDLYVAAACKGSSELSLGAYRYGIVSKYYRRSKR